MIANIFRGYRLWWINSEVRYVTGFTIDVVVDHYRFMDAGEVSTFAHEVFGGQGFRV